MIKETKEMLIGINELAIALIEKFKDGVQAGDLKELWAKYEADPEFKAKLQAAYDNYKAIPEELKEKSVGDLVELGCVQLSYLPKILEAAKKA